MEPTFEKIDYFYYDPNQVLGRGAFGTVYKAYDERNGAPAAVKVIPSTKLLENEDQYNLFMREINILREIKGEHVICLWDVKRTVNELCIFTDYCDGGDLEKKLKSKYPFTEIEACSILKQIADAFVTLENLHIVNAKGLKVVIMHRHICAANILFHQGRIKVADFGFAKLIDEVEKNIKKAHTLLGTPIYMAPQMLNDENYSVKCDIWSTGVLFYEVLFGKLPWTGHSVPNLYNNMRTKPLTFPKTINDDTKDLLTKMLKIKEEERLSWKQVYEHPALKNIDTTSPSTPVVIQNTALPQQVQESYLQQATQVPQQTAQQYPQQALPTQQPQPQYSQIIPQQNSPQGISQQNPTKPSQQPTNLYGYSSQQSNPQQEYPEQNLSQQNHSQPSHPQQQGYPQSFCR